MEDRLKLVIGIFGVFLAFQFAYVLYNEYGEGESSLSISPIGDMSVYKYTLLNFTLNVTGEGVVFSDNFSLFDIDSSTGNVAWRPTSADIGTHIINFTATDASGNWSSTVARITVTQSSQRFTVYGDSRTGHTAHQTIVNRIEAFDPAFVIHVGDMVETWDSSTDWDTFRSITANIRYNSSGHPAMYPCPGNHEYDGSQTTLSSEYIPTFNYSPVNESSWYSFDFFGIHFISIDLYEDFSVSSDQYNWLSADLVNNTLNTTVVFFHESPYSSGPHGSHMVVRSDLCPLFDAYQVDIAFSGHNHLYERTWPMWAQQRSSNGTVYVTTGGGGAPLHNISLPKDFTQYALSSYHYIEVDMINGSMHCFVVDNNSNLIDNFVVG